jgi:hypothetical protein
MRAAWFALAACLYRLGCSEPAATIAGFAFDPVTAVCVPELSTTVVHLRDVLGNETYEYARPQGRDGDHGSHGNVRI